MKVKLIAGLVAGLSALSLAAPAQAAPADPAPTQCTVPAPITTGPARASHSPRPAGSITPPLCIDVQGICVTVLPQQPGGPARTSHRVAGEACVPIAPECAFTVEVPVPPVGPSRPAHSTPRPGLIPLATVDIPALCQDALNASLAIPPTGNASTPITLIAGLCLLVGGGLVVGQRRLARH